MRICIRPLNGTFGFLAIMDIRARSISFTSRPRRPDGPPDHERAGETITPSPHSNSQTSVGKPTIDFGISLSRPLGATVARSPNGASDGGNEGRRRSWRLKRLAHRSSHSRSRDKSWTCFELIGIARINQTRAVYRVFWRLSSTNCRLCCISYRVFVMTKSNRGKAQVVVVSFPANLLFLTIWLL